MAKSVQQIEGVVSAEVNFASGTMLLEYDPALDPRDAAVAVVRGTGHGVEALGEPGEAAGPAPAPPGWLASHRSEVAVGAGGALIVLGWLVGRAGPAVPPVAATAVYAAAIIAGGTVTWRRAWVSLKARALDMNVLMTIAVIGAAAIGEWAEGATVIFLFALGGILESRSLARTRRSIRDLMDLTPPTVRLRRGDTEAEVAPAEAAIGEVMVVRPGERIALDGTVTSGNSAVDESPVTGESVPTSKGEGDAVFAGSLNTSGLIEVRVTALAADSTLARVIFLVEEAQASRAPVQTLVERFTRWYTPAVVVLAAFIAVVPPLAGPALGLSLGGFEEWIYRALVLLVISCPCALVISTPVAIVSAITRATRDGVLVKGGAHLETAASVRAVAFDKTGTLTRGRPEVAEVVALGGHDAEEVLELAAALEAHSNHPLARAVTRAAGGTLPAAEALEEVPGRGVRGRARGRELAVGSTAFAEEIGALDAGSSEAAAGMEDDGRTVLVVAEMPSPGGPARPVVLGIIGVADQVRDEARGVVRALRLAGVAHTVMLTGDNERTAAAVAKHAGMTQHMARLMPEDKVDAVRRLRERYGGVAMVGDGINDAPALAAADLGIAMGAAGSDTAIETADVALMSDDLEAVPRFFALGRRTVANIRQNVGFSVAVKVVVLVAAVFGYAPLWLAVFADTGVALIVILNGLRLLRARPA